MRTLWAVALLIGCGGAQPPPTPTPSPLPDRTRAARPMPRTPGAAAWRSNRYEVHLNAHADLAGRRATIDWTLDVRALKGDQQIDLYLDLPPDAAIDHLALDVRRGVLSPGRAAPALSAQRVYERVTAQRIDPALIEQVDARRYRLRVFPLNRQRTVRLRYHTLLPATADGMLLQIPRPHIVGEPRAWPNAVRVEARDAASTVHATDALVLRLPYDHPRAEFEPDAGARISQWQFAPVGKVDGGLAPRVVDVRDGGVESVRQHVRQLPLTVGRTVIGRPAIEVLEGAARSSGATLSTQRVKLRGATDLVALLTAAVPHARALGLPIVLSTAGHDRLHTLEQLRAAIPDDVQVHVRATPGANMGVLAALADAGRGHLIVNRPDALSEPLISDLRIEVLEGDAAWLPLPRVQVAGAPLVLTARHTGPLRARLHGTLNGQPFQVDLPPATHRARKGLRALWHRHQLRAHWGTLPAVEHARRSMAHGLVTRSISQAVFEREQDYAAAQSPQPPTAPSPPRRVVVQDDRVMILDKIYFASGAATLWPRSLPLVDQIAAVARQIPSLTFAIIGHTDDRERHAITLGLKRAIAVRAALLARGVGGDRMTTLTQGARRPIEQNTPRARQVNRRVEFRILSIYGRTQAPRDLTPPTLSAADRRRLAAALIAQRGGAAGGGTLDAVRAQLTDLEKISWLEWLYTPAEHAAVIDALKLAGQPEWARKRVLQLLAERKDWARLSRRVGDDLKLLSAAHRAAFLGHAQSRVFDLCKSDWGSCTGPIDAVAAIDPARATKIANFATLLEPLPTLATLKHAPPGAARGIALSRHLARATVTAGDLTRIAKWAEALDLPALRCRILRARATYAPAAGGTAVTDAACQGPVQTQPVGPGPGEISPR